MITQVSLLVVCATILACGKNSVREAGYPKPAQAPLASPEPTLQPSAAAAPLPPSAAHGSYPVKWSSASALELNSPSDARARYVLDEPDLFGELEGEGRQLRPTNCVQWAELHSKNYEPASGVEETPDSGAKLRCSTLKLIETARPAERSYVRDLSWDSNMLAILPVEIATSVQGDDARAIEAASAAGMSFKQFDPKARVKGSTDKETLEILQGDRQMMIVMYPMAWGDFDFDGTDDMAMTVVNGATHGTLAYSRLLTVTRSSSREKLHVIGSR
jgi:hypothetical protein